MSRKKKQKIDEDNRGKNSSELKTESPSRPACLRHPESFPQYTRDECCLEAHLDAAVIPAEITGNPHSFISTFRFHAQSRANQNLQNIPHLSNSHALLDPKSSLGSLKRFFYYLFIYLDFIFLIFFLTITIFLQEQLFPFHNSLSLLQTNIVFIPRLKADATSPGLGFNSICSFFQMSIFQMYLLMEYAKSSNRVGIPSFAQRSSG